MYDFMLIIVCLTTQPPSVWLSCHPLLAQRWNRGKQLQHA